MLISYNTINGSSYDVFCCQSFGEASHVDDDADDEWEEKLRDECHNEYNMNGGAYEQGKVTG